MHGRPRVKDKTEDPARVRAAEQKVRQIRGLDRAPRAPVATQIPHFGLVMLGA